MLNTTNKNRGQVKLPPFRNYNYENIRYQKAIEKEKEEEEEAFLKYRLHLTKLGMYR